MNSKIYKLKQLITGPKIQSTEPLCIKDPKSGELITDYEKIKETYLDHTTKILSKNKIREEDEKEYEEKVRNHNRIMEEKDIDDWELDAKTFYKVFILNHDKQNYVKP